MMPRQATAPVSIKVQFIDLFNRNSTAQAISAGHGYKVDIAFGSDSVTFGSGATRGLAVHPVGMSMFSA
jgi:hypothetical protein